MCGIVGYVQRRPPSDQTITRMMDRVAHRGPDGAGVWRGRRDGWHVALGHRRLAIIDPDGGRQPLSNERGTVWISYNGEIYNFAELRRQLQLSGHEFATRCDSEVIVHHYEEHGASGLPALSGMFAFAIWDRDRGRLLLARDRVGIKPLYYAPLPDGGLAFASELTALLAHPDVDRTLDPAGLASYLFLDYAHPPRTLVRGARKLEPGHCLCWSGGELEPPRRYWQLPTEHPGAPEDATCADELACRLRETLDQSVQAQLVADVPVGVFLSGGIDSSLVTVLAQRHASRPLQTFSIAFADRRFDESAYARRVADYAGTRHVQQTIDDVDLMAAADAVLVKLDEPMADPSILPTYLVSQLAARHVKVVLGGDGGDELWGGYPTYRAHRLARRYGQAPRLLRNAVRAVVSRVPVSFGYQSLEWKAKRFALRWDDDPSRRHLRWMSNVDLPDLSRVMPGVDQSALDELMPAGIDGGCGDGVRRSNVHLAQDFCGYLPGSVLAKVDRASMAHGLEVRPPMLDDALVDLAFSLPECWKVRRGVGKFLLKRAAVGLLPPEIISRRKRGFAVPLARWIAGLFAPRVRELIAASPLWDAGLLDRATVRDWFSEHLAREVDRSRPLWSLLVLDAWFRRALIA